MANVVSAQAAMQKQINEREAARSSGQQQDAAEACKDNEDGTQNKAEEANPTEAN